LASSGWTYNYTFVLFDYETESMWYPATVGAAVPGCGCVLWCIAGEYAGRMLTGPPYTRAAWDIWYAGHPTTKVYIEDIPLSNDDFYNPYTR